MSEIERSGVTAAPADTAGSPSLFPPLWVLSSSGYGARVAAQRGLGLAFAAHMSVAARRCCCRCCRRVDVRLGIRWRVEIQ